MPNAPDPKVGDLVKWWTGDKHAIPHVGMVTSLTGRKANVQYGSGDRKQRIKMSFSQLQVVGKSARPES